MTIKLLCGWFLIYGGFLVASFVYCQDQRRKFTTRRTLVLGTFILGSAGFAALVSLAWLSGQIPWNYIIW